MDETRTWGQIPVRQPTAHDMADIGAGVAVMPGVSPQGAQIGLQNHRGRLISGRGRKVFGLVIAATVAITGSSIGAARADVPPGRTITFTSHFSDKGTRGTLGAVDGSCPNPTDLAVSGTAHFESPLETVDTYKGCLRINLATLVAPPGVTFHVAGDTYDTQTGTLVGCGTGSFVMHQTGFTVTSVDLAAHTWHLRLHWALQSGTGAFKGASGSGTGEADFFPPTATVPPTLPNSGTYRGAIACRHRS